MAAEKLAPKFDLTIKTMTLDTILRAVTIPNTIHTDHGGRRTHCPTCGHNLLTAGLTAISYTFEICDCGTPDYTHLVEQLHHRFDPCPIP